MGEKVRKVKDRKSVFLMYWINMTIPVVLAVLPKLPGFQG